MRQRMLGQNYYILVVWFFSILLFIVSVCNLSEASVVQGRKFFFNNGNPTYSGIRIANEEFKSAIMINASDQEANLFYSVTRILADTLNQPNAPEFSLIDTVGDMFGSVGMTINNNDIVNNGIPFTELPKINGVYSPPATMPSGEKMQAFLAGHFIELLDASIANLAVIDSAINITLTAEETGDTPIEIDYGDIVLYRSFLYMVKSFCQIISSYNLNIDISELINKTNEGNIQFQRDLLDKYHELLKLIGVKGKNSLENAKRSLLKGIDDYRIAFNYIRSESDNQEDDLFYFGSREEIQDAENFLIDLEALKDSLNQNTSVIFTNSKDFPVDSNFLFGNADKAPLDIRKFLPRFDANNNIVAGSFLEVPVFNGIFTDLQTGNDIIQKWQLQTSEPLNVSITVSPKNGQIPFSPLFFCIVDSGTFPYIYSWDFGDGITGTGENIHHTYSSSGIYRVIVTVTDAEGRTGNDIVEVSAVSLNSIKISPSNATLTQPGEEIHFLVKGYLSSGEITTPENIKWDTSNSNVVSTENGKIVSVGEGTATITASVGNLTAQAEVTVSFTPVAIEVSPVLLFLEKGKSAEPVVSVLYSDGRRNTLTDSSEYSLTATTGTDNVQINGKKITAIANGISDIEVKAKFGSSELSASLRVNVTAPVPLNITPASIRVKQSESVVIEIDGGTPPYSVSLVPPSSSSGNAGTVEQVSGQYIWTVTAPSKGGEYLYSILDSSGQKAVLTMTVLASLTIQFQNASPAPVNLPSPENRNNLRSGVQRSDLEKFVLKAVGGTPPFKWFSTSGEITSNPSDTSQITYIPPSSAGIYTVTVVDSGGQSQDFKVSTIVQLNTIPEKIYLTPNESSDISIFGGVSPFTVSADAGVVGKISYYPGVGVFSYTAPAASGDYMITVKDSAGNTVRVYATVSPKLTVSPSKVYLRRNQTKTFQIAGGVGSDDDIYITTLQGEADNHPENMKFVYNSLGATGSDVIIITDLISGSWAKVEIEIINSDATGDFFITPSNATLLKKESRLFKSVGGIGQEIVWKSEHGTISGQKQPSIKYTAPDIKPTTPDMTDTTPANHLNTHLYAADLNTREASAGIYVISDKVVISPSQVFLKPGEHAEFQGHFGTEEYKFTWTKGEGSVDETSGILTYTAPSEVGTYYITVFDTAGNSSKAEVVVRGGAKRTKIKKTDIFEIANPSPTPNSETQPVGVGNVQKGGKTFSLAFDFPNYKDGKGEPVPMNFYVAAFIPDMNLWVLFDEHGNLFDLNNITACMSNMTNAVYTESLKFDYCNPDSPLKVDMYILAVESKYDINNNLSFQPADAPYELWHYSFSFPKCQ